MQYTCNNCKALFTFEETDTEISCSNCNSKIRTPKNPWEKGVIFGFRYKIVNVIGKGGHGVICLARDILEEKNYALKIFFPRDLTEDSAKSFLQEAQLARSFNHENIVKTHGGNLDGNILYIVQSWICGLDLIGYEHYDGRLSIEKACYIMIKVADALQFIWDNFSIIHRDIKPANILVDVEGNVLLTDFGIMLPYSPEDDSDDLHCTPDYVSPEAATGEDTLDIRSDFYSLGATFYRLLAGKAPFTGENPEAVIMKRLDNDAPSLTIHKHIPKSFAEIISKLMQYKKELRFQNAAELKAALGNCINQVRTLKIKKLNYAGN